jgi:hypothetical protein
LMRPEFPNQLEDGTRTASSDLAALVKQSGLAGLAGGTEELASQAFFAKFFPESDDSGSSHTAIGDGRDPNDTMRMDDLQEEMLLGGFTASGGDGDFFNLMGELDAANASMGGTAADGSAVLEKHSQLHDQFNNYNQQSKYPMATEISFELCQVLYDGYCKAAGAVLSNFADEEVALLVAKYEKLLGAAKLRDSLTAFTLGFKSSSASQGLNGVSKDRQSVEKNLQTVLSAFNDQHTAYLTAKSVFDKKAVSEKGKSAESRRLAALAESHLQLVRLVKMLAEVRSAWAEVPGLQSVIDLDTHLSILSGLEEKTKALLNESQSL